MNSFLTIGRYNFKPDWTVSKFFIAGTQNGFGIEDEIRDVKVMGETAMDYGTYPLAIRQSPHFSKYFLYSDSKNILIEAKNKSKHPDIKDFRGHDLIWIKDTPRHSLCLIHWGNSDEDTDGCYIVGAGLGLDAEGQDIVTTSRLHYMKIYPLIYPLIKKGGQFIEIKKIAA